MALPLAVLVYAWSVDESVSGSAVVVGIIVYAVLLATVLGFRGTAISYLALGGVAIFYLLSPLYLRYAERGSLKRMLEEDIERYQRTISFDPKNAAAHRFLGEAYFKQGKYDEAIAELERAIELMPDHSQHERSLLRRVVEAKAREEERMIRCAHCGKEIPALSRLCPCCAANPRENFFLWLARPENMKEVFRTTAVWMIVITILLPLASLLPSPVLGTLIIAALIVGAVMLYRSY